jgi:U32 family peptidase
VAQTGAKYFGDLMGTGLRHYRVELLEESADEAKRIIGSYQELLRGRRDGAMLWRELKAHSQLGVTSGTLREE